MRGVSSALPILLSVGEGVEGPELPASEILVEGFTVPKVIPVTIAICLPAGPWQWEVVREHFFLMILIAHLLVRSC